MNTVYGKAFTRGYSGHRKPEKNTAASDKH